MNHVDRKHVRRLATAALVLAASAASAQTAPVPQNVVSLSASATVEVPQDWLSVVFTATHEGSEATAVQGQLKRALDAALAEARKLAQPGQVEVRTGGFSLSPRYAAANARGVPATGPSIIGWRGSAELVVEGRDSAAIAQLTGKVGTMTIARVGHSLSRQAREKVEAEVAAMAIERFRARADAVTRQFGFGSYTLREVNVNTDGGPVGVPMMRLQATRAMADGADLPVEAGKASVTATVNGSVQMK